MTVYIDVVFAINFLMDMTIIWAAGMLNKEKIRIKSLLLGAVLGAVVYILSLFSIPANSGRVNSNVFVSDCCICSQNDIPWDEAYADIGCGILCHSGDDICIDVLSNDYFKGGVRIHNGNL